MGSNSTKGTEDRTTRSTSLLSGDDGKPHLPPLPSWDDLEPIAEELRVLTFNVWFDSKAQLTRAHEVVRMALEKKADVICLQEVTKKAFTVFRDEFVISRRTHPFHHFSTSVGSWYGVAIFSRFPLNGGCAHLPFPSSRMGRGLMMAEVHFPWVCRNLATTDGSSDSGGDNDGGGDDDITAPTASTTKTIPLSIRVGTAHFESMDSHTERMTQFDLTMKWFDALSTDPALIAVRDAYAASLPAGTPVRISEAPASSSSIPCGGSDATSSRPSCVASVVCGDTNLEKGEEPPTLNEGWVDAHLSLGGTEEDGLTWKPGENYWTPYSKAAGLPTCHRLDRFFVNLHQPKSNSVHPTTEETTGGGSSREWRVAEVEVVGKETFEELVDDFKTGGMKSAQVHPSDHYGVLLRLRQSD
eukprot:TRINITY_DN767_c3_g1_i2.p1 TRINITY_DN767_c3_g1~~TRINITY_DN767_c3_g1_i2.p1  ORF type:complete len:413 (+),score=72.09 TRINITY_DN767_c3_g1_i2:177-1415(+)